MTERQRQIRIDRIKRALKLIDLEQSTIFSHILADALHAQIGLPELTALVAGEWFDRPATRGAAKLGAMVPEQCGEA